MGALRQYAPADVFYRRPADEAVARFFGGTNFVPGTSDGGVFRSALGALHLPAGARTGPGTLTFRPESVKIGSAGENALTARLIDRLFLGTHTRLRLTVGDTPIEAVLGPDLGRGARSGQRRVDLFAAPRVVGAGMTGNRVIRGPLADPHPCPKESFHALNWLTNSEFRQVKLLI